AFGVSLGAEPWALLLPTVGIVFAGTAFGLVVASTAPSREAVLPLGSIVIMTMAAVGGCWWPIDLEPDWTRRAALASPPPRAAGAGRLGHARRPGRRCDQGRGARRRRPRARRARGAGPRSPRSAELLLRGQQPQQAEPDGRSEEARGRGDRAAPRRARRRVRA